MRDVILDEVNIKELIVLEDDSEIVSKSTKANFKSLVIPSLTWLARRRVARNF